MERKIVKPHNTAIPNLDAPLSVIPAMHVQQQIDYSFNAMKSGVKSNDIAQLIRNYMQKLIDEKLMLRLSEVKKLDILDITSFADLPEDGYSMPGMKEATMEERAAIERLGWYSMVPCFEYGAVKLNKFRYIVFEIHEIDPEGKYVIMRLYDYLRSGNIWQAGVATTVKASDYHEVDKTVDDTTGLPETHHILMEHYDDLDFEELYTMYDRKELGWTEREWKLWSDVVVAYTKAVKQKMKTKESTSQCESLANIFLRVISRCNAMLELNKPSRPVKKEKAAPQGKRTVGYEKGSAPERKIRNVGILRVQSKDVPRKPCLETVVTYKVAKWTVRGHIRRYPSGKEVYIKPGIRQRKALAGTGETTATTIRFRKKKNTNSQEE